MQQQDRAACGRPTHQPPRVVPWLSSDTPGYGTPLVSKLSPVTSPLGAAASRTTKSHWPVTVVAWRRPVTVFAGLYIPRVKVTCHATPQLLTVILGVATPNERLLLTTPSRACRGIRRSALAAWHFSALKQTKMSWEVCGSSSRLPHQQWQRHSFFAQFLLNRLSLNNYTAYCLMTTVLRMSLKTLKLTEVLETIKTTKTVCLQKCALKQATAYLLRWTYVRVCHQWPVFHYLSRHSDISMHQHAIYRTGAPLLSTISFLYI